MYTRSSPLKLRQEVTGADRRFLDAYLDEAGNLHIDGQDLGPGTSLVSDDGEYEWFQELQAADLPRLVEALGGAPGTPIMTLLEERYVGAALYELERIVRESGIVVKRQVWSG